MQTLFRYVSPPHACSYLPRQTAQLQNELVANLTAEEYQHLLLCGWRRFGGMLFRPQCPACQACQSIRVDVHRFRPNRSQRRTWALNWETIQPRIDRPTVTPAKLRLYDRFHAFQSERLGWPDHPPKDAEGYLESFVNNPAFTQEWCYYLQGRLVGIGYVDELPAGLSAIYFFYDPAHRDRGLGVFNVLCLMERAWELGVPYVYLGYYVAGCRSLVYKANYRPNQVLDPDGSWRDFLE
jgi:arginyl-tRNA--protein-N-Asp/Glu arginylyltransferase